MVYVPKTIAVNRAKARRVIPRSAVDNVYFKHDNMVSSVSRLDPWLTFSGTRYQPDLYLLSRDAETNSWSAIYGNDLTIISEGTAIDVDRSSLFLDSRDTTALITSGGVAYYTSELFNSGTTDDFIFEAVFKVTTGGSGSGMIYNATLPNVSASSGFNLYMDSGYLYFTTYDLGSTDTVSVSHWYKENQWAHVMVFGCRSTGNLKMYVNGIAGTAASGFDAVNMSSSNGLIIGNLSGIEIAQLGIWSSASMFTSDDNQDLVDERFATITGRFVEKAFGVRVPTTNSCPSLMSRPVFIYNESTGEDEVHYVGRGWNPVNSCLKDGSVYSYIETNPTSKNDLVHPNDISQDSWTTTRASIDTTSTDTDVYGNLWRGIVGEASANSHYAEIDLVSKNLISSPRDYSAVAWTAESITRVYQATPSVVDDSYGTGIIAAASSAVHRILQDVTTTADPYCFSVIAKKGIYDYLWMNIPGIGSGYFNLSTGKTGTSTGVISSGMFDRGDGWYECFLELTLTAASNQFQIATTNTGSSPTFTGDGTSIGMYLAHVQLSLSSNVNLYNDPGDLSGTGWSKYDSGDTLASSTNSNPYDYVKTVSIAADSTDGPHGVYQTKTLTVANYQLSATVKKGNNDHCVLDVDGLATSYFNINSGSAGTTSGVIASGIVDKGDGWYLCWMRFTADATPRQIRVLSAEADNDKDFSGDGSTVNMYYSYSSLSLNSTYKDRDGFCPIHLVVSSSSGPHCWYAILKPGDKRWVRLESNPIGNTYAHVDLLTGTIGDVGIAVFDTFYKKFEGLDCYLVGLHYNGALANHTHRIYPATGGTNGDQLYTGDGSTVDLYVGATQHESVSSYSTSGIEAPSVWLPVHGTPREEEIVVYEDSTSIPSGDFKVSFDFSTTFEVDYESNNYVAQVGSSAFNDTIQYYIDDPAEGLETISVVGGVGTTGEVGSGLNDTDIHTFEMEVTDTTWRARVDGGSWLNRTSNRPANLDRISIGCLSTSLTSQLGRYTRIYNFKIEAI